MVESKCFCRQLAQNTFTTFGATVPFPSRGIPEGFLGGSMNTEKDNVIGTSTIIIILAVTGFAEVPLV
jgi:hypothetical protein